jgi:hypothetical protein
VSQLKIKAEQETLGGKLVSPAMTEAAKATPDASAAAKDDGDEGEEEAEDEEEEEGEEECDSDDERDLSHSRSEIGEVCSRHRYMSVLHSSMYVNHQTKSRHIRHFVSPVFASIEKVFLGMF